MQTSHASTEAYAPTRSCSERPAAQTNHIAESSNSARRQDNSSSNSTARALKESGVCTVAVFTPEQLPGVRDELRQGVLQFPEYKRQEGNPDRNAAGQKLVYALGGFAALGNPASFHSPIIRKLRSACLRAAVPSAFRKALEEDPSLKLEVLFDRLMIRQPQQKPVAEAWHRDETPADVKKPGDILYGGWLNLDSSSQSFSHVPGTHEVPHGAREVDEVKYTGFNMCTPEECRQYSAQKVQLEVPPGHLLIFRQDIVHEIVSKALATESLRLFVGFRLTKESVPLFDNSRVIADQGVPRLPSTQKPPMYSANHLSCFLNRPFRVAPGAPLLQGGLVEWSRDTIKDEMVEVKKRKRDGLEYKVCHRFPGSLKQYGFNMYAPYTDADKEVMMPRRKWKDLWELNNEQNNWIRVDVEVRNSTDPQ